VRHTTDDRQLKSFTFVRVQSLRLPGGKRNRLRAEQRRRKCLTVWNWKHPRRTLCTPV